MVTRPDVANRLALRLVFADLHDDGLEGWVREQRVGRQLSWDDIALEVERVCGMAATGRTIHRMFEDRDWAKKRTKWWESDAVLERYARRRAEREQKAVAPNA